MIVKYLPNSMESFIILLYNRLYFGSECWDVKGQNEWKLEK